MSAKASVLIVTGAPQIRDALIALQKPDGSWEGGRYPHKTPMAIIILGTPYRYLPIYQR